VKIWDTAAQAWKESNEVPMRWDPDAQARVESTGRAYDLESKAWTERWSASEIYGIEKDITDSSPVWKRTNAAVGLTATASIGNSAGKSDFDDIYPWSGMERVTLSSGDVMVKIPAFYFRRYRDGDVEHIEIAEEALDGFILHPAFNHADAPKDCVYVGAYSTSNNNQSLSGKTPTTLQTRANFRTKAQSKGTGWGIIDIATISAIQMLYLVEYAHSNSQTTIGRGCCDYTFGDSGINTGSCDSVPNLTGRPSGTDGKVDVIYRGIEGMWGNFWALIDGFNMYDYTYYICNNPSDYAEETISNYTALSYNPSSDWTYTTGPWYIVQMGIDPNNPHIFLPTKADLVSANAHECDGVWIAGGWVRPAYGAGWYHADQTGIFAMAIDSPNSKTHKAIGSRLMYIPQ
jgi:hypothetical protein